MFFLSLLFVILLVWFQGLKIVREVAGGGRAIHDVTVALFRLLSRLLIQLHVVGPLLIIAV